MFISFQQPQFQGRVISQSENERGKPPLSELIRQPQQPDQPVSASLEEMGELPLITSQSLEEQGKTYQPLPPGQLPVRPPQFEIDMPLITSQSLEEQGQ